MRKVLKWIGIVLGGLLLIIILIVAAAFILVEERMNRTYEVTPVAMEIPEEVDFDLQEWPLFLIDLCVDCHGPGMAGQVVDDDLLFGRFAPPNITAGEGSSTLNFSDADWIRAIRHGIDDEGKPLLFMPSQTIGKMSDEDIALLIAYLKSLPPIDNEIPEPTIGPLGRIFMVAGMIPEEVLPAEVIDHDKVHSVSAVPEVSAEYGEYLAFICAVCHSEDMSGGPGAGEGMNLTPGGQLSDWSEEDFLLTLRTGFAPDGEVLDDEEMPWRAFRHYSDNEIRAMWLYLQSIPAIETEHR